MQFLHHTAPMLSQLRSFLVVVEEGSLHRAADRLRMSQPALSRQMQALEHEVGGRLLERTSTGVEPTNGGYALLKKMKPVLAAYDRAMLEVRRELQGGTEQLCIGFLASAAREYLAPALQVVRQAHPTARLKLLDLTPGEQYQALRDGEIDVGLVDESAAIVRQEFHQRRLQVVRSYVALPEGHALAATRAVRLAALKDDVFVETDNTALPGLAKKMTGYCRTVGKFRARLIGPSHNISESLDLVSNEGAVILLPAFMRHLRHPGVVLRPLADREVTWELMVVWQRGKIGGLLKTLLDGLFFSTKRKKH